MNLMKVLEGKEALGNKSNTKDIGEHKVCCYHPGQNFCRPSTTDVLYTSSFDNSFGKLNRSLKRFLKTSNERPEVASLFPKPRSVKMVRLMIPRRWTM